MMTIVIAVITLIDNAFAFSFPILLIGIGIITALAYYNLPIRKLALSTNHQIPENNEKGKYLAIDCEMVGTGPRGKKSALARVSLVDWDLNVVLDTHVQVHGHVTDYRTQVSGIQKKHLKGPHAMTFSKCRQRVLELLEDKVLVGHGLENDFDALHIIIPPSMIRDTSLYQPLQRWDGSRWKARKLRELVKEHLGDEDFQAGAHDSIHDARASMKLFHLFHESWESEQSVEVVL